MVHSDETEITLSNIVFKAGISAAAHPIEYAKVLIQIGYEPLPPKRTYTLFGRPAWALPNVFTYIGYIRRRDGWLGCYRGLTPKICGSIVGGFAHQKAMEYFKEVVKSDKSDDGEEKEPQVVFVRELFCNVASRLAAIIASQPFQVITLRSMAQFIGRETKYEGIFGSIREVYNESGILGFFSGLIPRACAEIGSLVLASSLTFVINTYVVEDATVKSFTTATFGFLSSTVTYPFHVVATCMAVSGSGLRAGGPPVMPVYVSWTDCWSHLSQTKQLKRGSSLLWRYYTPPLGFVGDKVGTVAF